MMGKMENNWQEDRERLETILNKEEFTVYHEPRANLLREWFETVLERIFGLFPEWNISPAGTQFLSYMIIGVFLVVLLIFLYWFAKQIVRQKAHQYELGLTEDELSLSYEEYISKAEQCSVDHQYREGTRYMFLALLLYLNKREIIDVQAWKTNWDYLQEINDHANHNWESRFQQSSLLFERVWYGKEAISQRDFHESLSQIKTWLREEESQHEVD